MGIGLLKLATGRLTDRWLHDGSKDEVTRELCLVRSELASLRDALQGGGAAQPTAGGDGARMARLAGDGGAVQDGRWHLVGAAGWSIRPSLSMMPVRLSTTSRTGSHTHLQEDEAHWLPIWAGRGVLIASQTAIAPLPIV
jgi:hypothetical protein